MPEHWPARWNEAHQRILNAHEVPVRFHDARHHPIPVTARVVWERDGEQHFDTDAAGWTRTHVLVTISDPRAHTLDIWLPAEDVGRR